MRPLIVILVILALSSAQRPGPALAQAGAASGAAPVSRQADGVRPAAPAVDAAAPQLVLQDGHVGMIFALAYSLDGRVVATGGLDGVCVWDARTGRELRRLVGGLEALREGKTYTTRSVALSGDGARAAAVLEDGRAHLWATDTGRELGQFGGGQSEVSGVALSPDGRTLLTGGPVARLWDLTDGRELKRLDPGKQGARVVAYSRDGRQVLTGGFGKNATARLWDVATAKTTKTFKGHGLEFTSVAFTSDGRGVLTGNADKTARLWDIASGKTRQIFPADAYVFSLAISPDGRTVAVAADGGPSGGFRLLLFDAETAQARPAPPLLALCVAFSPDGRLLVGEATGIAQMLPLETGRPPLVLDNHQYGVRAVAVSGQGDRILTAGVGAQLWDAGRGFNRQLFSVEREFISQTETRAETAQVNCAAFSPDGSLLLVDDGNAVKLFDARKIAETRTVVHSLEGHRKQVTAAAFSRDGRFVVTGSEDATARLWDVATGQSLMEFKGHAGAVTGVAISPDDRFVLTGGAGAAQDGAVRLWQADTGTEVRRYPVPSPGVSAVAFSQDGRYVLTGGAETADLWVTETAEHVRPFVGHTGPIKAVAFAPNGAPQILTGSADRTARLWDLATGQEVRRLQGHAGPVTSVAFFPDGRRLLTGSLDGSTRLWDAAAGGEAELCRLVSLQDLTVSESTLMQTGDVNMRFGLGNWVVVDPQGRFDTDDFSLRGAHWVVPDEPLQTLPLGSLVENYYEPSLLSRVLAREPFAPVTPLARLNRAIPKVRIVEVASDTPHTVKVTVEVEQTVGRDRPAGAGPAEESGAFDLNLYRDGKLVGYAPGHDTCAPQGAPEAGADAAPADNLDDWRRGTQIQLDAQGKARVTFCHVQLPSPFTAYWERVQQYNETVEFSAYAYNRDRLKSDTARSTFQAREHVMRWQRDVAAGLVAPANNRVYLITFGVNVNDSPTVFSNLLFSVNDARTTQEVLGASLKAIYPRLIQIPLVSDYGPPRPGELVATKENLAALLGLLAGRSGAAGRTELGGLADDVGRAGANDLIIIFFSGHGYLDEHGEFYLIPKDTGGAADIEGVLRHSISSRELSQWLRDVDAGEMVLAIDACQSAGAVGRNFRPGPVASRGLGKLSFDKGMRILAATRASDKAVGSGDLQMGLLTYSLIQSGLDENLADTDHDGGIKLGEWLAYGEQRVPELYSNEAQAEGRGAAGAESQATDAKPASNWVQRPKLFDFAPRLQNPYVKAPPRGPRR